MFCTQIEFCAFATKDFFWLFCIFTYLGRDHEGKQWQVAGQQLETENLLTVQTKKPAEGFFKIIEISFPSLFSGPVGLVGAGGTLLRCQCIQLICLTGG